MDLKNMHPLLPASTAVEYGHRAALGLERHRHEPGVSLAALIESEARQASLHWAPSAAGEEDQLDRDRVTEDAAEAIALALAHGALGWVVRRRLQRRQFADWLLRDPAGQLVALEVSGLDHGKEEGRLREKLEQVRRTLAAEQRAACVVQLSAPRATLARA